MAQASFRATGWDPLLIIAQIISLQSVYYIVISLLLLIALALTGAELSLDAILDDGEIRTDTVFGWTLGLVWLVNAVMTIPILVFLVQRAKLVLDFVLTLHFFHIAFVWIHTGHFPTCGAWWILQVINAILMTLGGEWACMRREMEPIMVSKKDTQQQKQQEVPSGAGGAGSSSSASSTEIQEVIEDNNTDWIHVGKKQKRKVSDPRGDEAHYLKENDEEQEQDAPLTRAVGKAKKVILQGAQRAARSSSISTKTTTNNKGKRYENIPLHDVDQHQESRP
ncbi:integral membrane protein S linking to the trans Golgi network-domain-containing protein [Circinella umbellata]|nr:integral membrane protein S linking to the trans Golgi network-domain-containing protein [Circinella umbellata]